MNKTTLSIHVANAGDVKELATLARQTFQEAFGAYNSLEDINTYLEKAYNTERLAADLQESGAVCLLAKLDSGLVGFARLANSPFPLCITAEYPVQLVRLYVSAAAVGTGVGAALMRASIDWASKSGHKSLWLRVWEHNHRARAFYERWQFEPVGAEPAMLGSDGQTDVLMQLVLSDGPATRI